MSFTRYPVYKDSGIDWIGEIPDHWSVVPLARISSQPGTIFIDGDWVESKDLADEGIRYITTGNVGQGNYKEQGRGYISQNTFDRLRCTEVLPGDVLISRLNLPIGRACVAPDLGERVITSVDNVIARPDDSYSRSYLAHMLSSASHFANMEILARGTTMQRISRSVLGQVRFAFPGFDEQKAIATFLDHETSKIDALIAEQQRLIELLQEKRQAVISHAVTKGLNPDAPMKDSGVEWLGEVPEHWEVAPLKYQWLVTDCKHVTAEFTQEGYPLASIKEAQGRWIDLTNAKRTTKAFYNLLTEGSRTPEPGDLVFTRNATVGEVAEVPAQIESFALGQDVVILKKLNGSHCSSFAWHLLRSTAVANQLECAMIGSTFRRINVEQIKAISVPIPPSDEQASMAIYLEEVSDQWAKQEQYARHCVSLLQERRSALISAAVTGQIDVRGLVPR